jgi:hypothetical protein
MEGCSWLNAVGSLLYFMRMYPERFHHGKPYPKDESSIHAHQIMMNLPDDKVNAIKKDQCQYCIFSCYGGYGHMSYKKIVCNYMFKTGKRRPCSMLDCVSQGVFQRKPD